MSVLTSGGPDLRDCIAKLRSSISRGVKAAAVAAPLPAPLLLAVSDMVMVEGGRMYGV
jgi:hypothetical protein